MLFKFSFYRFGHDKGQKGIKYHTFDERKLTRGITVCDKTSKVKSEKKLTHVFKKMKKL